METDDNTEVTNESILQEANRIINGERAQTYGDAQKSFGQIADLWGVYLNRVYPDVNIDAIDVANMMILMKISCAQNGFHRDSYVDIIGYAALTEKIRYV